MYGLLFLVLQLTIMSLDKMHQEYQGVLWYSLEQG